ncbi:helicase-exonuclease AddAB subunit AddA [Lactobacillus terrae]|uniref:helicase-exonuclease AddAB subunit AddA n=1 Tax=Lactobacillus terrae TaxID=2269374 RepID=UPI000C1B7231|nr:helicase-exonuclease AddAB subunit AddA [Lactobacillus terrae]
MPKWTEDQEKAIYHTGHDILVSAAAGSGKTTILIERIVELLKNGSSIDSLLVSTFTKAAANEMKERLEVRLKELTREPELNPDLKKHLQSQIYKIPMANISTLHSFFNTIIEKFYYVINLDPSLQLITDDTQIQMLKDQAIENVFSDYYEKDDSDFLNVVDNFSNDRSDEGLITLIDQLYNFAITNTDTEKWLNSLSSFYNLEDPFETSDFYKYTLIPNLKLNISSLIDELTEIYYLSQEDLLSSAYTEAVSSALNDLKQVYSEIEEKSFDEIRDYFQNFKMASAKRISKEDKEGEDPTLVEALKEQIKSWKDSLKKISENYFSMDAKLLTSVSNSSANIIAKLVEIEIKFINEYKSLKLANDLMDFNDLEHYAYDILNTEIDGENIAQDYYQNKFSEIMLDEYQDVNAMQENIIQKIKTESNHLFMVGDIKQSIYGFRQAAPYIFAQKYRDFQKDDNDSELIQLSMNFRSAVDVDNFVNTIFERIMDEKIGEINYDNDAKLVPGTSFPEDTDTKNEFYLINNDENSDKRQDQIDFTISKIQKMISDKFEIYDTKLKEKRPIKYSDIVILARNKSMNTDMVSSFAKADIPLLVTASENYFQTTELQILVSFLKIIDNPIQDIPLVAVLRSPIVKLGERQLAEIRLASKGTNFYNAVKSYVEKNDDELANNLNNFLNLLDNYREYSNKNSITQLIWKIYKETGILDYISGMPGGKQRAANLNALYQRANSYEKNRSRGLHDFITYIEKLEQNDKDLAQPSSIDNEDNTVKVMTIHGSKGLEFPVVFFVGLGSKFNNRDVISANILDTQLGIGIDYTDQQKHVKYKNIQKVIISNKKNISSISEEMRLLYVALTRAKQKLIMVGSDKTPETILNKWDSASANDNGLISVASRLNSRTFQDLIGISTLQSKQIKNYDENTFYNSNCALTFELIFEKNFASAKQVSNIVESSFELTNLFKTTVQNILNFDYSYQSAVNTTAYQSVSEIKRVFSDPDEDSMLYLEQGSQSNRIVQNSFDKPNFLKTTESVSPAQVGSATHLILQKINIKHKPTTQDFNELVNRLIQNQTFTKEIAQKVDVNALVNMYNSDLGDQIIKNNENVSREYAFSLLIPSDKLFKNNDDSHDKILVHGIIDGLIEYEDHVVIFDYKTDNIKSEDHQSELIKEYSGQLNLYEIAIQNILNKPVTGKYLYFLNNNNLVNLA